EGVILAVDTMPNESGQYPIDVEIDNEEGTILPGMTVSLQMKEVKVEDTIIVPTEAVLTESDEQFVYIREEDQAKRTPVEVQETQSDKTAVEGDLEKGDQVITSGQHTLTDGSTIEVKEGNEE